MPKKNAYGEAPDEVEHTRAALCRWLVDLGVITPKELSAIGEDRRHHTEEDARWLAAVIASGIHLDAHIPRANDTSQVEEPGGEGSPGKNQSTDAQLLKLCENDPCVAEAVSLALLEVSAFHAESEGSLETIRRDLVQLGQRLSATEPKRIEQIRENVGRLVGRQESSAGKELLVEEGWGEMQEMLREVEAQLKAIGEAVVRWGKSVSSHIPSRVVGLRAVTGIGRPKGRLMLAVWQHLLDAGIAVDELARRVPGTTQQLPPEQLNKRISERIRHAKECRTFRRYSAPLPVPEK